MRLRAAEGQAKLSQSEIDNIWQGAQLKATQTLNAFKGRAGYAIMGVHPNALTQWSSSPRWMVGPAHPAWSVPSLLIVVLRGACPGP